MSQRLAALPIGGFESDHVMGAERSNRTGDKCLEVLAFAYLPRDLRRHALVRRALHQLQFMPHLRFGEETQKRGLLQLDRQSLLEHPVEDFIACLVLEVGQQDRVFLRERGLAVEVKPPCYCDNEDRGGHEDQTLAREVLPSPKFRPKLDPPLQLFQVREQISRSLVSLLTVFAERLADDLFKLRRRVGRAFGKRRRSVP